MFQKIIVFFQSNPAISMWFFRVGVYFILQTNKLLGCCSLQLTLHGSSDVPFCPGVEGGAAVIAPSSMLVSFDGRPLPLVTDPTCHYVLARWVSNLGRWRDSLVCSLSVLANLSTLVARWVD